MLPKRVYQFEQTGIPEEAKMVFRGDFEEAERIGGTIWEELDYGVFVIQDPNWKPEGWLEHVKKVRAWQLVNGEELWELDRAFSWPWSNRIFKSRSSAMDRVNTIRHWGGTAELVEADLTWITTIEANAIRKAKRDQVRINKLKAKIREIEGYPEDVPF